MLNEGYYAKVVSHPANFQANLFFLIRVLRDFYFTQREVGDQICGQAQPPLSVAKSKALCQIKRYESKHATH